MKNKLWIIGVFLIGVLSAQKVIAPRGGASPIQSNSIIYVDCVDSMLNMTTLKEGNLIYVKSRLCGHRYGGGLFVVTNSGKTTDGGTVFAFNSDLVRVNYTQNAAEYTVGTNQDDYFEHTLPHGNINWGSFKLMRPDSSVIIDDIQYFPNMINYATGETYWLYRHCLIVQDPGNQFVRTIYDTISTNIRLERIDIDRSYVSIDWFGAIRGDSTINNAGVIEEAMRAADKSGVKRVYVPGLYYYQSTITIPNNLVLYGDGPGLSVLRTSTKEMFDYFYSPDGGSTYPNRTFRRAVYNVTGFSSGKITEKNTDHQKTFYRNQHPTTFRIEGIELDGCIENHLITSVDTSYPNLFNNLVNGGFHNGITLDNSDSLSNYYLSNVSIHSFGGNLLLTGSESYNAFLIANDLVLGNSSHNHFLYTVSGIINNVRMYGYSNGSYIDGKGLTINNLKADFYTNPVGYNGALRIIAWRGEDVPFSFVNASNIGPQNIYREHCVINNADIIIRGLSTGFVMGAYQGMKLTNINFDLKEAKLNLLENLGNNITAYKYGININNITVRLDRSSEISITRSTSTNIPTFKDLNVDGFHILGQTNFFPKSSASTQNTLFSINLGNYTSIYGGKLFSLSDVTKDSLSGEHFTVSFANGGAQPTPTSKVFWFDVSGSDSAPSLGGSHTYHEIDISSTTTQNQIRDSIVSVLNNQDTLISQVYSVYGSTGHVGYDPQGYGYINVDSDSTRINFQNHILSYNKAPISWHINNLTSNIPFSDAQGLLDIAYAPDTLHYDYNINFTNCDFPITGATNIMFRYIGNAKYQGYSTFNRMDLRFENCKFRYRDLSTLDIQKFVEPWFNVARFKNCEWVNVTCGASVVEKATSKKQSDQIEEVEFTATASQAIHDFPNCLMWEPRRFEIIAANDAFNEWADSVTVTNARVTLPGHATTTSTNTGFRLHLKSGIPNGTVVKFRYKAAISDFNTPRAYNNYDLTYDLK